ncbi:hypothetical protein KSP40_PGU007012 [Platanthera guangdongensis]|uniref:CCD97-like C-terminal domain-containing protein n=1 Tax=Platanthera guangdongensis TaxID=2320717 RepID=A0ABR2ML10_9ASPA
METTAMEEIAERLSTIDGLYFPGGIRSQTPDASQRKETLLGLLSRDVPIFLERYGGELTAVELGAFDSLRTDYEIGWHIDHLRRRLLPPESNSRARSPTVRNRRRAHMDRLIRGGKYFSEDSMRDREPYLHHLYVGMFQDPAERSFSRPGEKWSETLLRRNEEKVLLEKIRVEQQRLGVARRDWVGVGEGVEEQEEEEEEEEEESEDDVGDEVEKQNIAFSSSLKAPGDGSTVNGHARAESRRNSLSTDEMQDQLDQFTVMMQQKFLAGEDAERLDYHLIDNDEGLDDHWSKEASRDAEEKYFDED